MSEKLTVAELLARSGRDSSGPAKPRRRRSLDQGGVSVSELTGRIPVVPDPDEDKPEPKPERPEEKTGQMRTVQEAQEQQEQQEPQEREPAAEVSDPADDVADAPKVRQGDELTFGEAQREQEQATSVIPVVPEQEPESHRQPLPRSTSRPEPEEDVVDTAVTSDVTSDEQTEVESASEPDVDDEYSELEESLADDEVIEYEDDTISWPAMIGQALLAVVIGVGVFFGFGLMWNKMPAIIVLVLALAVTLLAVGLVHALLRHRDKWLMLLAFVVGIVLTIGPRLILGI